MATCRRPLARKQEKSLLLHGVGLRVLLSNNTGQEARSLLAAYPSRIGHLIGPGGWREPFPFYAIDNGRFASWSHKKPWDVREYFSLLVKAKSPEWLIVPDIVGDRDGTLREWDKWYPVLADCGTLAMACQDGMTPDDVPPGVVAFIGGTTEWKRRSIWRFAESCERVHVGRINTEKWLWECHEAGVESCDGTGWFRGCQKQLRGLWRYLRDSEDATKRCKQEKLFI